MRRRAERERIKSKRNKWCMMQLLTTYWPVLSPWVLSLSHNWCLWVKSSKFIYWACCPMIWNIPLVSSGQLSWLWSLTASCAPAPWQSMGNWNSPWLRVSTTEQPLKHQCGIDIILLLNPKLSPVQATKEKKLNSIPVQTRAHDWAEWPTVQLPQVPINLFYANWLSQPL